MSFEIESTAGSSVTRDQRILFFTILYIYVIKTSQVTSRKSEHELSNFKNK
jgi:hypothetical protein